MKITQWYDSLHQFEKQGRSYVLVTLITAAGSTPREGGSKMIVCDDTTYDTIGGGNLEHVVTQKARTLLAENQQQTIVESFPLGSKLGQCCGGAVKVLFEVRVNHCQVLCIFGAGHVAQALVPILSQLPLQIKWIDSRPELFGARNYPDNVSIVIDNSPVDEIKDIHVKSWLLVLTHDHQLDFNIVYKALLRSFPYVGMIGSEIKAKRFLTRLKHRGLSDDQIKPFVSPVGELSVSGKRPIEVAVSISSQIINMLNKNTSRLMDEHKTNSTNKYMVETNS